MSAVPDHRRRLPDRRECERFAFEHPPLSRIVYCADIGRYPDGRPAEIFLTTNKASSAIDAAARDVALLCSLLLQYGCPAETIRSSLTLDNDGQPVSPLGVALALAGQMGAGDAVPG
jgi:ribonucleoside-diphosphate reductase alpha chain